MASPSGWAEAEELETTMGLMELFHEIDADRSGSVSAEELSAALRAKGKDATARQVSDMMRTGDADADGMLTLAEFAAVLLPGGRRAAG